jgi:hypothetical protein
VGPPDCSTDNHSTGSKDSNGQCICLPGWKYDPSTLSCSISTPPNCTADIHSTGMKNANG